MFSAVIPLIVVLCTTFLNVGIKHIGPIMASCINWVVFLNPIIVMALVAPYRDAIIGKRLKSVMKHSIIKFRNVTRSNMVADTVVAQGLEPHSNNPI